MKIRDLIKKYTEDIKKYVSSKLSTADDTAVHNSGNETINGVKTFGSQIVGTIDKAEKDKDGNIITETYATKQDVDDTFMPLAGGTLSGNIVPDTTGTRNLGTESAKFKEVWADEVHISQNTLYVGDVPVIGSSEDTIVVKADPDQSIQMKTSGEGLSQITSESGVTISSTGINSNINVSAKGANASVSIASDKAINITSANVSIDADTTIKNLTVTGTTTTVNTEDLKVKDNVIELNSGETGEGVSKGTAGIKVNRGDALPYLIQFDESDDLFKVGEQGDLEIIASRPYVDDSVSTKANDSDVVHNSGNETIGGIKTFSNDIVLNDNLNLRNNRDNGFIRIQGSSAENKGSRLILSGKDRSGYEGAFELMATDGVSRSLLKGTKDGSLTWCDKEISTSDDLSTKANDSDVVHKSGDETISGTKTFSDGVVGNVTGNCSGTAGSVAWDNVIGKPSGYTPSSHTHDDRYYTESEIDTKLNGKSDTSHTHSNYLTEHQDISGKADKSTTLSGYGITDAYTKTQVDTKLSDLVSSAPETLDTLNELASALGNDPNFATTVATQIGTKANDSDVVHNSGNETIDGNKTFSGTTRIDGYDIIFADNRTTNVWGKIPVIRENDGLTELGQYVNFHATKNDVLDYCVRLRAIDATTPAVGKGELRFWGGSITPSATDATYLGSSSLKWKDIYTTDVNLNGTSLTTTLGTKANDSEVLHKSGDEIIGGNKIFSQAGTKFWKSLDLYHSEDYKLNTNPSAKTYQYVFFTGKSGWYSAFLENQVDTDGASYCNLLTRNTSEQSAVVQLAIDSNNVKTLKPVTNNDISLGTSANKWKDVHATTLHGELDGNSSTSTTLKTARSLWGNSFNGSQDLSGNIEFTNNDITGVVVGTKGRVGTNDFWRVGGGATASNAGFLEIASAADSNEPIYVRQYKGEFTTVTRTATLLDASGNTQFPGTVTATGFSGNVTGNSSSATKLQTARTINGTSFDGTANITTANWGTARNISIQDADGTNISSAVSVNGANDHTLKLPSTIKATITGNVTGNLTGNVTGNCSGTAANVTGTVAIANGGTGATSRLNAFKNLTNESVGENAQYFITITSNWGKAGYTTVAQAKKVLGLDSVANVDSSKAIVGITRSGTTFTYTCVDGTTGTFTQQDNNTTYASMSAAEATTGTATTARSISAKVLNGKIDEKISALVASAPETLDTLNELASALGNDPNFATTVTTQIGTKANANHNHDSVYVKLTGGTITNNINKVGISCSWKDGRTNAVIKTNATSSPSNNQYVPCVSAKSYQGSWELGTYTNNDCYLTYVTDADFDAGSNKATTQYKFCSNGTLVATKFQGALVGNADTATQFSSNAAVTLTGDVTGTASSKKGWSVAATVKNIPAAATFEITAEEIAAIIV